MVYYFWRNLITWSILASSFRSIYHSFHCLSYDASKEKVQLLSKSDQLAYRPVERSAPCRILTEWIKAFPSFSTFLDRNDSYRYFWLWLTNRLSIRHGDNSWGEICKVSLWRWCQICISKPKLCWPGHPHRRHIIQAMKALYLRFHHTLADSSWYLDWSFWLFNFYNKAKRKIETAGSHRYNGNYFNVEGPFLTPGWCSS